MAHLFMAIFWALVAAAFFLWRVYSPDERGMSLPYSNFSVGWLALVLVAYNLVRWWSRRMIERSRRSQQDVGRRRGAQSPAQAGAITDPQLQFGLNSGAEGSPAKTEKGEPLT